MYMVRNLSILSRSQKHRETYNSGVSTHQANRKDVDDKGREPEVLKSVDVLVLIPIWFLEIYKSGDFHRSTIRKTDTPVALTLTFITNIIVMTTVATYPSAITFASQNAVTDPAGMSLVALCIRRPR